MFASVVIPTYNRRSILEKCLLALEQQVLFSELDGYEVVVVAVSYTHLTLPTILLV